MEFEKNCGVFAGFSVVRQTDVLFAFLLTLKSTITDGLELKKLNTPTGSYFENLIHFVKAKS